MDVSAICFITVLGLGILFSLAMYLCYRADAWKANQQSRRQKTLKLNKREPKAKDSAEVDIESGTTSSGTPATATGSDWQRYPIDEVPKTPRTAVADERKIGEGLRRSGGESAPGCGEGTVGKGCSLGRSELTLVSGPSDAMRDTETPPPVYCEDENRMADVDRISEKSSFETARSGDTKAQREESGSVIET